jgi:hypothetical protein
MNKKDLDALNELYLSVYGEEQLNEAPVTGFRPVDRFLQGAQAFIQKNPRPTGTVNRQIQTAQQYRDAGGVGAPPPNWKPGQPTKSQPPKPTEKPPVPIKSRGSEANPPSAADARKDEADPRRNPTRAGSPPSRPPAGSSSAPPSRPAAASGPVLSKKDGVEGTGVGADFKARAFTDAERTRYDKVRGAEQLAKDVSQVAANKKAREKAASAPKPAIGKLGNTSFERRTPTSAELRAAQAERATQKASGQDTSSVKNAEKALQAAQKTNLPKTGPSPAIPDLKSVSADLSNANTVANLNRAPAGSAAAKALAVKPATSAPTSAQVAGASQGIKPINNKKPTNEMSSYEWPSAKTIRDIADAYSSIYEAKKVDQDQDGDNDFADVRIARMIASGMSRAEAIAAVKNKEYNEEVEIDEATRMRKELGKEGETATRQELARRSNAYQRSGSVDKTIAAAERGANRTTARNRDESEGDYKTRMQKRSQTLNKLAANRRKSVRSGEGLRGYAAKVEGSDRDLQSARGSARSAGTLTPREKKQLNMEAYEAYEFVVSYLLENNFAETINDANVIIENMSDNWFTQIMEG